MTDKDIKELEERATQYLKDFKRADSYYAFQQISFNPSPTAILSLIARLRDCEIELRGFLDLAIDEYGPEHVESEYFDKWGRG